jgi:hypothetical protein
MGRRVLPKATHLSGEWHQFLIIRWIVSFEHYHHRIIFILYVFVIVE